MEKQKLQSRAEKGKKESVGVEGNRKPEKGNCSQKVRPVREKKNGPPKGPGATVASQIREKKGKDGQGALSPVEEKKLKDFHQTRHKEETPGHLRRKKKGVGGREVLGTGESAASTKTGENEVKEEHAKEGKERGTRGAGGGRVTKKPIGKKADSMSKGKKKR